METEVPILYRISMQGFRDNYLFEPIPFEAFRQTFPLPRNSTSLCPVLR